MLILPSAIRLPARRLSRPAPRWVGPRHLNPRTRSRRRAAVFGCGGTAFCGFAAGAATSAVRRGGPKGWERAGQALRPSFKAGAAGRAALRCGAAGASSSVLGQAAQPPGARYREARGRPRRAWGKKRVLLRVREASLAIPRSRPTGSLRSCRSKLFWLARPCKKRGRPAKAPQNLPKRRTLQLADRRKHPTGSCARRVPSRAALRRKFTDHSPRGPDG